MFERDCNAVVFREIRDKVGGIFDCIGRVRHSDFGAGKVGNADELAEFLLAEARGDGMNFVTPGSL